MPLPPFVFEPYQPVSLGAMAELIQAPARARAAALRTSGAAQAESALTQGQAAAKVASTLGALGGLPLQIREQQQKITDDELKRQTAETARRATEAQIRTSDLAGEQTLREMAATEKAAQEDAQLRELFAQPTEPTLPQLSAILGPVRAASVLHGVMALKTDQQQAFQSRENLIGAVLGALHDLPEGDTKARAYQAARQNLLTRGLISEQDAPPAYDKDTVEQMFVASLPPDKREEYRHPKPIALPSASRLVNPQTGAVLVQAAPDPSDAATQERLRLDKIRLRFDLFKEQNTLAHQAELESNMNPLAALSAAVAGMTPKTRTYSLPASLLREAGITVEPTEPPAPPPTAVLPGEGISLSPGFFSPGFLSLAQRGQPTVAAPTVPAHQPGAALLAPGHAQRTTIYARDPQGRLRRLSNALPNTPLPHGWVQVAPPQ